MSDPPDKRFSALCAAYALAGLALYRSDARDGPMRLFCCRRGLLHQLASIDDAERFLASMTTRDSTGLDPRSPVVTATGEPQ